MKPWTVEQIEQLPKFGSEMGWFYGLVCEDAENDEEEPRIVLAEIFPGMGYALVYPNDEEEGSIDWNDIKLDLENYLPPEE